MTFEDEFRQLFVRNDLPYQTVTNPGLNVNSSWGKDELPDAGSHYYS